MLMIRTNRARTFMAALEVLRSATDAMIEQLKFDIRMDTEEVSEQEVEDFRSAHGDPDSILPVFDDALEYLPDERNGYVVEAELETDQELTVSFKDRK